MSKISCELCGTVFQDTEEKCPTCGTVKPEEAEFTAPVQVEAVKRREYTPTKGGRFSESNVKKRLKNKGVAPVPVAQAKPAEKPRKHASAPVDKPRASAPKEESNKGLVITAIILSVAILAMLAYIYITFFMPKNEADAPNESANQQHQQLSTNPPETEGTTTAPDLSCKSLVLSSGLVTLTQEGESLLLNVTAEPADTVDAITFVSSDPNVATVTEDGMITAVSAGEAVITVTCGVVTAECKVVCEIAPPTTEPPETVPPTTEAPVEFNLRKTDVSFYTKGESWLCYKGDIPLTDITFTVGNTNVAIVRNGYVVAVGPGTTIVTAEYKGIKVECIVRCSF